MIEIGSDATGRRLAAFLAGMAAMGRLESSTSGGGLVHALPLPFCLALTPSSDALDNHSLASYWSAKGGGGSLSSLTCLAGGGSSADCAPVDSVCSTIFFFELLVLHSGTCISQCQ